MKYCISISNIVLFLGWILGSVGQAQEFHLTVGFDQLGQVATITYPDQSQLTYNYQNELGIQSNLTYQHQSGQTRQVITNLALNPDETIQGYFMKHGPWQGDHQYDYDDLGRLTAQSLAFNGQYQYRVSGMSRNAFGYLASYQRSDTGPGGLSGSIAYEYTDQGELLTFSILGQTAAYYYDAHGNITRIEGFQSGALKLEDYELPDQQTFDLRNYRVNTQVPDHPDDWLYDDAGRLLRDDRYIYQYDATGRLGLVRDAKSGIPLQCNLYDGHGHRNKTTDILSGTTTYSMRNGAGKTISEEIDFADGPNQKIQHLLHHNRAVAQVVRVSDQADIYETRYYDHLGSPVIRAEGTSITRHEYGPFGQQMNPAIHEGPHGYTGHDDDPTGLTYMMARTHDPVTGRFGRPDPARDIDPYKPISSNLYVYTSNNPVNLVDPTGLMQEAADNREDSADITLDEAINSVDDAIKQAQRTLSLGEKLLIAIGYKEESDTVKGLRKGKEHLKQVKKTVKRIKGPKSSSEIMPLREGLAFLQNEGHLDQTGVDATNHFVDLVLTMRTGQLLGNSHVFSNAGDSMADLLEQFVFPNLGQKMIDTLNQ